MRYPGIRSAGGTWNVFSPLGGEEGFPDGTSGEEPACQCRRHKRPEFHSWFGKIRRRRAGNPLQYSCLESTRGQRSLVGYSPWGNKESDMTEHTRTGGEEGASSRSLGYPAG